MSVRRFGLRLSGRREPICRPSAAAATAAAGGLRRLCWGLSGRLARGGVSFTVAGLVTELEAAGELLMLQDTRKYETLPARVYKIK